MIQSIKNQVQYFVANKIYMIALILATIGGYGYGITHGTMGIDDVCIELYFEDGLGIAVGRWPFYFINKIFHVTDFEPFLVDLIAAILMMGAAILFSALIRYVISYDVPIFCYIIFSTLFVDYSLVVEVFVYYLQNGVPAIYCLTAVALFVFYYIQTTKMEKNQRIRYIAAASALMCVATSFYESAANLFLFGVLLVMLMDSVCADRMNLYKMKNCLVSLFLMVRILVYAIIIRSVVTRVCIGVLDIKQHGIRDVGQALWILEYPGRILTIIKQIFRDYFIVGLEYYPIKLFVIATVLFVIGAIWLTVTKKKPMVLLISVATYISLFVLSFFQEEAVPYRANQMLAVFVAISFFSLSTVAMKLSNRLVKSVVILLLVSVVYNSAYDLNQWFSLEYKKNQMELDVVHRVAYELESGGYDIKNKPVVFVGEYRTNTAILKRYSLENGSIGYEIVKKINESMGEKTATLYPYVQVLSESLINWGMEAFYTYEGYNSEMIRIFEKEGYSFLYGGNELYNKGVERITDQERYPVQGYIREYHDCIIVRF